MTTAPPHDTWTTVDDVAALTALLGEPHELVVNKGRPALIDVDRDWLAATPFCVLATASAIGECDASPKGDPAGQLVHVLDERTVAIAERPATVAPTATGTSSPTPTSA